MKIERTFELYSSLILSSCPIPLRSGAKRFRTGQKSRLLFYHDHDDTHAYDSESKIVFYLIHMRIILDWDFHV